MTTFNIGMIGIGILVLALFLKMPVGFAMGFIGFLGYAYMVGIKPGFAALGQVPFDTVLSYTLCVVPFSCLWESLPSIQG